MNKKTTLGKRILSVLLTLIMVFSMVPASVLATDGAVELKVSELSKEENGDMLYPYYYHAGTDKRTFTKNDSIEFDGLDHTSASAYAKVYTEGKWYSVANKDSDYKVVLPEGEWLISDWKQSSTTGEIRFVHRYVESRVYLVRNSSNILELRVGEADSEGMAAAALAKEDELYDFFSGLNIQVRKTVDKLEKGSFKISITGKDGTNYTDFFEYYDSSSLDVYWEKWIRYDDLCLGPIPDDEVKIFIEPNFDLLRVKASAVGGKGGSISPADAYYQAFSTQPKTYTVTPDEGYEIDKIDIVSADGNPVTADLDESTGKFVIKPADLRELDAARSIAEIKVYFRALHNDTHCLCGGVAYDGHDTHADVQWQPWTQADSLPEAAGNYYLKNNVTLAAGSYTVPGGVNICLNGYSITGASAETAMLNTDGAIGITDCGAAGRIGDLLLAGSSAKLTMYGGTIAENSTVIMDGGAAFNMTGNAKNDGVLRICNDAGFTMDGNAKNNNTIKLKDTSGEAHIVFGGHAEGGSVTVETPQNDAEIQIIGNAKITELNAADCAIKITMADNAEIDGTMDVGQSRVYGNFTCTGEIVSGIFDENGTVVNNGSILGGIFYGKVTGTGMIKDSATVDVVIDTNGGNAVEPQKVLRGQKAKVPTDCKKAGYAVAGWYKGEEAYDFSTPVLEGFTLTAQWTANSYTAHFDSDGGSAVESRTLTWDDRVLDGVAAPAKTGGYAFDGWKCGGISVDENTTYGDLAADDTVKSITLTAQWLDIEKPTGAIILGENKWNSFLNTITFGLFFGETQTVTVTADDNSGKAVKIEYLLSNAEMTEAELGTAAFTEYDGEFSIDPDNKYVIYVRLTDAAGNTAYISSDGFVIDTTSPVIEGYANGQTKKYTNGQRVEVCADTEIRFIDATLKEVYIIKNGYRDRIWDDSYILDKLYTEQWIAFEVQDEVGNVTTVEFYVHKEHSFNEETGVCATCGYKATVLIKYINMYHEEKIAFGNSFDNAFGNVQDPLVTELGKIKLYGNAEKSDSWSTYGTGKWVIDLNGYAINNPPNADLDSAFFQISQYGDVTIVGNGALNVSVLVKDGAALTIDGNCSIYKIEQSNSSLTVNSGSIGSLVVTKSKIAATGIRKTALYGGGYGEIKIVDIEGLTCADLLGRGYRFAHISLEQAKVTEVTGAAVELCYHEHIDENYYCSDCGMQFVIAVRIGNVEALFDTFEDAIRYAEQNDGCTVKLLQDITFDEAMVGSLLVDGYKVELTTGRYTIDLNGKSLDINDNEFFVYGDVDLTIGDSAGVGRVISSGIFGSVCTGSSGGNNAKLTVTGGEFTVNLTSFDRNALVLKGGSFVSVISHRLAYRSPFVYLSDGYAFAFSAPSGSNNYASEENVKTETGGDQKIENVTVVPAPLTIDEQPTDLKFYLTSGEDDKYVEFVVSAIGRWWGDIVNVTFEKEDGMVIEETVVSAYENMHKGLSAVNFKASDSGSYRIKLELKGYVLYSDTFSITVAECEHPAYDEYNKCSQCGCDLAAAIVKDGKTSGYVTFADALAAAQTDENKGCTLKLLADVSGKVAVKTGSFTLEATDRKINGALNVAKGADLTVSGGRVTGNVICAKGGKLTAVGTHFAGTINCVGEGNFTNCYLAGAVAGKSGLKLQSCEIPGDLSISGNAEAVECTVSGAVTVNNGGSLKFTGGTYGNTVNVKSGGTLEILSGTYSGKVTAESGSKLTVSGGKFTNITVNGQHLIDCLAEGKAFEDMNNGFIIDGRVGIAGDVQVVDHTHTCVWKTDTHEKLCGCGYVEATDTEAPVISGIVNFGACYGPTEFTVTDENDFTVWVDGKQVTLVNGKYTVEPDNQWHTVTATDVAGNTVTYRVGFFKIYNVTLPTGVGYTVKTTSGGTAVEYGEIFSFIVEIAAGYSKTERYKVLVNGKEPDVVFSKPEVDSFNVRNVSEDLVITVEGVADITAPEAEVSIRGNSFKEFLNRISFGLFFKQTQTVEVKAEDAGSGIKKIEYLLSETAFEDQNAITGEWTELALNADHEAQFNIEPSQKTFVYVRVTDVSDNITVVNTDGVVVYTDAEAITGAMVIRRLDGADAAFAVRLNDNTVNAVRNGDAMLVYDRDYTVSEDGVITLKAGYLSTLAAGEYTIRVAYNPLGERFGVGDEPAMTAVKLTVEKRLPKIILADWTIKTYDGEPIDPAKIGAMTETNGAKTWTYKPVDADDSAYTATAPKDAGKYTVRLTTAETDNYEAGEATALFVIVQKEVTIEGVTVSDKIYDGNTTAEVANAGTISTVFDGDELTIKTGTAAYADQNVGEGKTVTFAGFALDGADKANYTLKVQPASTTASITPKELTIADLKVKDKQYDGTNTAEIDGTPALVGVIDGDVLTLVNGVPTFNSVKIGKNIAVSFTAFTLSGDSVTVGNYTLTQPTGITANIVEYVADGSEYGVNSNDWINTDFVITAREGYKLSLTDTANGEWSDTLSASDETDHGRLTFYVKNAETGVISAAVTENYKIDKTAPTGEVKLNERSAFQTVLNRITFGLFFRDDVNVKLTAQDEASGVKSVQYFKSAKLLSDAEVRAVKNWTESSDFGIKAEDMEQFIVYVRIEDNAGNVAYIGSDGATFDTTAPEIVGVENEKTYYVTKRGAADDENLEAVTVNGEDAAALFVLPGNRTATYVIRATDKAGNETVCTVQMQPLAAVSVPLGDLTVGNVTSDDEQTILAVERKLMDIAESFDDTESTDEEWQELLGALRRCRELLERIEAVRTEIAALEEETGRFTPETVKRSDREAVEALTGRVDALLNGENLTEAERSTLKALREKLNALLERLAELDRISFAPSIIEGAGQTWRTKFTDGARFCSNASFDEFVAVEVDGKELAAEDYTASEGTTVVVLEPAFLWTLSAGEHRLSIVSLNGRAETTFTVVRDKTAPQTGDDGRLVLWFGMLAFSAAAITAAVTLKKKKEF